MGRAETNYNIMIPPSNLVGAMGVDGWACGMSDCFEETRMAAEYYAPCSSNRYRGRRV